MIRISLFMLLLLAACTPPRKQPYATFPAPVHSQAAKQINILNRQSYAPIAAPDEIDDYTTNRLAGCAFPATMPPDVVWCKNGS